MKKIAILVVGVFFALFVTDFLIHGILMKSAYQATASLWRPESEMGSYFPFMLLGQFLLALFFSLIFRHGYKGKGKAEGVRYGFLMGGYQAGYNFVMYAVTPWPMSIVVSWIVASFLQSMILGVVCTALYRK